MVASILIPGPSGTILVQTTSRYIVRNVRGSTGDYACRHIFTTNVEILYLQKKVPPLVVRPIWPLAPLPPSSLVVIGTFLYLVFRATSGGTFFGGFP